MHGDSQYVNIYTCPVGATIKMGSNKFQGPAKILIKRGMPIEEYAIVVESPGYKTVYTTIRQKPSGWLWGNVIFGIIPGLAVDYITGGAYDLEPEPLIISMEGCSNVKLQDKLPVYKIK